MGQHLRTQELLLGLNNLLVGNCFKSQHVHADRAQERRHPIKRAFLYLVLQMLLARQHSRSGLPSQLPQMAFLRRPSQLMKTLSPSRLTRGRSTRKSSFP